jgi:hypothetical protein
MSSAEKTEAGKRLYNKRLKEPESTKARGEIAFAIQNLEGLYPTYKSPTKGVRQGRFLDLGLADSPADQAFLSDDRSYPLGARIVLEPQTSVLPVLVEAAKIFPGGSTLKPECCIPNCRVEIRKWVAWRLHYLFDFHVSPDLAGQVVQGTELALAWRAIGGFDFELVVTAFEWLWDKSSAGRQRRRRLISRSMEPRSPEVRSTAPWPLSDPSGTSGEIRRRPRRQRLTL